MTRSKGFGLLELMITLVVAFQLWSLAIPAHDGYAGRAKNSRAYGDIGVVRANNGACIGRGEAY